MYRKNPSRPVLFLIFMFCTTGMASALSVGLSGNGGIASTTVDGAPTKLQMGAGAAITAEFPFFDTIGPGISVVFSNLWPSDASGWMILRGYMELGLSVFVLYQARVLSLPGFGDIRAGGRVGMSASMGEYLPSTLVFFMPSADLAPFLKWTPTGIPNFSFSIALPARWLLRRDAVFSGSLGLELGVSYSFDNPQEEFK
jgi:hypothetical protein